MWSADGTALFYAAHTVPEEGRQLEATLNRQRVFLHRLGSESPDPVIFDRPERPGWLYSLHTTDDGRWLVILAAQGSAGENRVFLLDLRSLEGGSGYAGLPTVHAPVPEAEAGWRYLDSRGSVVYFATDLEAPRNRIVALNLATWRPGSAPQWREIVPESPQMLARVGMAADHFLGLYLQDAVPEVRVFDLEGRLRHELRLPQTGTTFSGFRGRRQDPAAYLTVNSIALPPTPYRLDPVAGTLEAVARPQTAFDPESFRLDQVFYHSFDGTRVPMFLAHREDVDPRSDRPLMIYGYGAYGCPAFPWFQPPVLAWLEQGGVYALPGIRGGGEYGDTWHEAGIGRHKQTAIDDFLAAAEFLVREGYTSPDKLAVRGGSASGVLAAAALVQRPELFAAGLINIPVIDLLRGHLLTGGSYRFTEFGSPEDPEDFDALLAYSPYHNLKGNTCYPAVLTVAGEKDELAPPVHAYKLTAALQHARGEAARAHGAGCDEPVLLRVAWGAGHSLAATPQQRPEMWASQIAFLAWRTGLELDE